MRKIPATMATQHPDNARAPYWERRGDGFISIHEELQECMSCFEDLGVREFMWDWEGKYADEGVVDKLFFGHHKFFKKNHLGRDYFLTFRLPNIWHERGYSLLRALMVILTSEDFARDLKFHPQPLFEVILPMTEKAEQLLYIQECFQKLARFKSREFQRQARGNADYLEMIPLIEGVKYQVGVGQLLSSYIAMHQKRFQRKPEYLRVFLARSDPALLSGHVANVLANKVALSEMKRFEQETGVWVYPILGAGSLIFRGGLNPERLTEFVNEYAVVRTVTIQSAFRYDYPLEAVKKGIRLLDERLPKREPAVMGRSDVGALKRIISQFERAYQSTIFRVVKDLAPFFEAVPRRRERRLHIGLLSYQRKVGTQYLPRAITFTAALYAIGVPPELIGVGQALRGLTAKEQALVLKYYVNMGGDIALAGRYLNRENLAMLSRHNPAWRTVETSVGYIEKFFSIKVGPRSLDDRLYKNISANALLLKNNRERLEQLIVETGTIRKSLG